MDARLAEDYEKTTADPFFFKNYEGKKEALEKLMDQWADLDDKVSSFL